MVDGPIPPPGDRRSPEARRSIRRHRRQRAIFRLNALAAWLLAGVLLVLVNYASHRYYYRTDLTRTRFYSLGEKTRNLLDTLDGEVKISVFFSPTHPFYNHIINLLKEYEYASRRIAVEYIDPHRDLSRMRELATAYQLDDENVLVFDSGEAEMVVPARDLVRYEYDTLQAPMVPARAFFRGEVVFSSAIRAVNAPSQPRVYFLQGHDERDIASFDEYTGYSEIAEALRDDNIDLVALTIGENTAIPADAAALIIAGPARRISQPELDIIRLYLEQSGRILMLVDPLRAVGLETILADWGIRLYNDLVLDSANTLSGKEVVVTSFGPHPVTAGLGAVSVVFHLARSVTPVADGAGDTNPLDKPRVTVLAGSSENGWAEHDFSQSPLRFDPETDRPGPVPIAAAVEKGPEAGLNVEIRPTRLVVIGDSDFVANGAISGGNQAFFLGALNWLLEREEMLAIDPKPLEEYRLTVTREQMRSLFMAVVLGIPAALAVLGLLVWWRRRA